MFNPADIENKFQSLVTHLSYPFSAYNKLLKIEEFINEISDDPLKGESYLLEIAQYLPEIINNFEPLGYPPEKLVILQKKTLLFNELIPQLSTLDGFNESINRLRHYIARLYSYTGNLDALITFLENKPGKPVLDWMSGINIQEENTPFIILQKAYSRAKKANDPVADKLERIVHEWSEELSLEPDSVIVPVVDRGKDDSGNEFIHGSIRRIQFKIFSLSTFGKDDIDINVVGSGDSDNKTGVFQAIAAARLLINETNPDLAERFISGQLRFDKIYALHEGRSAGFATAALIYSIIPRWFNRRLHYEILPDVSMTGNIDENGYILPVDNSTLYHKLYSIVFTNVNYFVVPLQQFEKSRSIFEEFKTLYPYRNLRIIGVENIREIIYDRRITRYIKNDIVTHLAKSAWRRKFSISGISTILILLFVVLRLVYGPLDRNPVMGIYEGKMFLIKNISAQVIEKIEVGEETVRRSLDIGERLWVNTPFAVFYDVTGDGRNEIIWGEISDRDLLKPAVIICKSLHSGEVLWQYELTRNVEFPRKPEIVTESYNPVKIIVGDFEGSGIPYVIIIADNATFFPAIIVKLDAHTGQELGHYVHVGGLVDIVAYDITGNGIQELIITGVNNSFELACLIVIDPRYISGHSPNQGDYIIKGYEPAPEYYYVLIPRTIIGDIFRYIYRYNNPLKIHLDPVMRGIQIRILDVDLDRLFITHYVRGSKFPYFYFNLQVAHIGTDDQYDLLSRWLYDQGIIDRVTDYEYFEEYKKSFLYWDGDTWQNEPVVNRRYLEQVKSPGK